MRAATVIAVASLVLALYAVLRVRSLTSGATRMTSKVEFDETIAQINAHTNGVAARITALEAKVAAAGLPPEQEEELLGELRQIAAGLEALAADPTNPVPEPEPTPDTPPAEPTV